MNERFLSALNCHIEVMQGLKNSGDFVSSVTKLCSRALNSGGKVMLCGNGGSAADAQHLAAELVGRFNYSRPALAGLALTTDTSNLTCIANDFGFDYIFSRQLEAVGRPGDVLILLSTSGNSKNIVEAAKTAKRLNISTVYLGGKSGGKVSSLVDYEIVVQSEETARIQEAHIFIGHLICEMIESSIFGNVELNSE